MSEPCMTLSNGRPFHPLEPVQEDIDISVIAHGLSQICRWWGQCREFYSVAQHSVLVAGRVAMQGYGSRQVLTALLHDAPEAYIGDIPRPLKMSYEYSFYRVLESRYDFLVDLVYGTELTRRPAYLREADDFLLAAEATQLMPASCRAHAEVPHVPESTFPIVPLGPTDARKLFEEYFEWAWTWVQDDRVQSQEA